MNTGTACGYLPQFGTVFTFAPFFILAIVIFFYRSQANPGWILSLGTGLIIGGAFGNLVDRLRYGFVVDFVQILSIPVFNVADASVSTAVVLLIYWSLREDQKQAAAEGPVSAVAHGASSKLMISFIVLLGILVFIGAIVCIWLPRFLPR
jgi:signal peptidase II